MSLYVPRGAIMRAFRERAERRGASLTGAARDAEICMNLCRTNDDVRSLCRTMGVTHTRRRGIDQRTRPDPDHTAATKCEPVVGDLGAYTIDVSFGIPPVTHEVTSFRDRAPSDDPPFARSF